MFKSSSIDLLSVILGAAAVMLILGIRAYMRRSGKSESARAIQPATAPCVPQSEIDPAVVAAIMAVLAETEKHSVRVHRIRYLAPNASDDAWQELGRAQLLITRQVGRKA